MQNQSSLNRFVVPAVLMTVMGCTGLGNSPMRYVGDTTKVAELETPDGFNISPSELRDIIDARDGAKIFTDHYYADETMPTKKIITSSMRSAFSTHVFLPESMVG